MAQLCSFGCSASAISLTAYPAHRRPNLRTACFAVAQTPGSLQNILADSPEREGNFAYEHELSIQAGELTLSGVVRHNQVTVSNADRYCYASGDDERLRRFMLDQFIHRPVPIRRSDRMPIGKNTFFGGVKARPRNDAQSGGLTSVQLV